MFRNVCFPATTRQFYFHLPATLKFLFSVTDLLKSHSFLQMLDYYYCKTLDYRISATDNPGYNARELVSIM
jgi:hypothetical protein